MYSGHLNPNRSIHAGDLIHREDVTHARQVARALKGTHEDGNAQVAGQVVYSAQLRTIAVENTHMVQQLRDIAMQLHRVNSRLYEVMAAMHNNRILARNARIQGLNALSPLQKTVPGSELRQARGLLGCLPDTLVAPAEEPAVGALPPDFSPNLPAYGHIDIISKTAFSLMALRTLYSLRLTLSL